MNILEDRSYINFVDTLMKMMWNVYQHYNQFVPNIQAQILKARQPIEKQLKVRDQIQEKKW